MEINKKKQYRFELIIKKYIEPNLIEEQILKKLSKDLQGLGSITIAIPEYTSPSQEYLLKVNFSGKVMYYKHIKVSITLSNIKEGLIRIKQFLDNSELYICSELKFKDLILYENGKLKVIR